MRRPDLVLLLSFLLAGCATTGPRGTIARGGPEFGLASYYSSAHDGHRTASGRVYDERRLSAAHRTLPFGTQVRVTNLENHRSVVVTVTDRGPFRRGRVIDVSRRAARELGFIADGTTRVRVDVLEP
jgi:rare lipoprotein A